MAVQTPKDIDTLLSEYCKELNEVVKTRQFAPFVKKWFADECRLTFRHESHSLAAAMRLWDHLLPKGETIPRHVDHEPFKVEDGRVFTRRALVGGNVPKPMFGLQETQFNDKAMITEINITSTQNKPDVEFQDEAEKKRLARIFLQFSEVFDEYFQTGKKGILEEWCDPDIHMKIDSTYWNEGVIGCHNRIGATAEMYPRDVEEVDGNHYRARVEIKNWGESEHFATWELVVDDDFKLKHLTIGVEI